MQWKLFSPTLEKKRWMKPQIISDCHHFQSLENFYTSKDIKIFQRLVLLFNDGIQIIKLYFETFQIPYNWC